MQSGESATSMGAAGKRHAWVKWVLAATLFAVVAVSGFYLWLTAPVMERAEMQEHFDAARSHLTSASPERLALGKRYLDALAELPEIPEELKDEDAQNTEAAMSARSEWLVSGRDCLEKLRALAGEGAGAIAAPGDLTDEERADWSVSAYYGIEGVVMLLCADMGEAAAAQDGARVLGDLRAALRLAETLEHRNGFRADRQRCRACRETMRICASLDGAAIRELGRELAAAERNLPPLEESFWGLIAAIESELARCAPPGTSFLRSRTVVKDAGDSLARVLAVAALCRRAPHEVAPDIMLEQERFDAALLSRWRWWRFGGARADDFFPAMPSLLFLEIVNGLAALRGTRIVLALELYVRAHGRYPDELAALVPACIDELPRDPYTDESFLYRRRGDSFLLYSVGLDLEDQNGNEGEEFTTPGPNLLEFAADCVIFAPPEPEDE